jgi:hypothetical protein
MMPDADLRLIHAVECSLKPLPCVTAPLTASIQPAKQQPLQLGSEVLALLEIVRDGVVLQMSSIAALPPPGEGPTKEISKIQLNKPSEELIISIRVLHFFSCGAT